MQEAQKHVDPVDPDSDPQQWLENFILKTSLVAWKSFNGTVRPVWICTRVVPLESPLKGHQPLYVFDFLILVLNI
jgi:hypothetical protein